jgi:type I restriction enzyme S subunit
MSSAKCFPFSEVCDINPSKQEIVELNDDLEVTFLPMTAVSETGVILEKKIKKLKDVKKGYTFFKNGDVLLAKITPCFENGKKAIVKELKNNIGFGSTEFHVLRPKEEVISEWIYYGVSLEDFRNKAKSQMTGTAGQKRVPKRVIESYTIPVPTKPIQEQIVKEIESRLSVCDRVEKTVKQNLSKIEYLRQSILKKAFEGKLVSQDPNDLSACELLKQIKIKKDRMSKNGK